jgi:hypothetical protein
VRIDMSKKFLIKEEREIKMMLFLGAGASKLPVYIFTND